MDPVTLVVAAMAAGVSAGLTETTSTAIADAYCGLRDTLRRRSGAGDADALVAYERDPQGNAQRLAALVEATRSDRDPEVVAAAQRLLVLADPGGSRAGKYTVDLRDAKGAMAGDQNIQINHF